MLGAGNAAAQEDLQRVVLLGDSITAGVIGAPDPGIPLGELLAIGLSGSHEFENVACSGTSSPMWTIRHGTTLCDDFNPATIFETFAIPALPADFLTIMLGTNDSSGFLLPGIVTGSDSKTTSWRSSRTRSTSVPAPSS